MRWIGLINITHIILGGKAMFNAHRTFGRISKCVSLGKTLYFHKMIFLVLAMVVP